MMVNEERMMSESDDEAERERERERRYADIGNMQNICKTLQPRKNLSQVRGLQSKDIGTASFEFVLAALRGLQTDDAGILVTSKHLQGHVGICSGGVYVARLHGHHVRGH